MSKHSWRKYILLYFNKRPSVTGYLHCIIFSALMSAFELHNLNNQKTIVRKYNILIAFSDFLAQHKYHTFMLYGDVVSTLF